VARQHHWNHAEFLVKPWSREKRQGILVDHPVAPAAYREGQPGAQPLAQPCRATRQIVVVGLGFQGSAHAVPELIGVPVMDVAVPDAGIEIAPRADHCQIEWLMYEARARRMDENSSNPSGA
jgi:hypothetical protein